jgi:ADP-ribosylglycohydrolase
MNHRNRIDLAKRSLLGVSIGDAFGDSFFGDTDEMSERIHNRIVTDTRWEFTDDTVMSIAVFEQLEKYGEIRQDDLAKLFCTNLQLDENRGYGATARRILREIHEGGDWREISASAFDGMGSMGNGAAMRANPIGAYFHDDLENVKAHAAMSAVITHSNLEAISGAIAVAAATAIAAQVKMENRQISPADFIGSVAAHISDSDTLSKIKKSISVPYSYNIETVKSILGNGSKMSAQDTVPFALWCAAHNLYDFEEGLWKAVSILGDRDTICAIVAGITIMSTNENKIPSAWIESVEDFEKSKFRNTLV